MELNHMLCFQLAKAHQFFNHFYKKPLKKYHLTYVQYIVLISLWNRDKVTVNQLSQQVGLNNGTLTPLLKRLQHKGWVTRTRDPKDERRVIISLTKYGQDKQGPVIHDTSTCLNNLHYQPKDYQKTMRLVKDIQSRLKEAIKENNAKN